MCNAGIARKIFASIRHVYSAIFYQSYRLYQSGRLYSVTLQAQGVERV